MPSLKIIKRRIASVSSTRQIVRAMDMVAAAKLQASKAQMVTAEHLFENAFRIMEGIRNCHRAQGCMFVAKRDVKSAAYVVVTSDRGLCGGYNHNLSQHALSEISEHGNEKVIAVGLQGWEFLQGRNRNILQGFTDISETAFYEDAERIGGLLVDLYLSGEIDEAYIIFTRFESALSYLPQTGRILPIGTNTKNPLWYDTMEYEPDIETFLEHAVPLYVNAFVYRAMVESSCCENAARMTNMHSAAGNADEIIDRMSHEYNRKRQDIVTQEITEITGGARALRKDREKEGASVNDDRIHRHNTSDHGSGA